MNSRHVTTAVTMLVLVAILILGVFVGVRELFAPLPGSEGAADQPTTSESPTCDPADAQPGRLTSKQVTVNVFNGGTRAGLAGQTLDTLAARGFQGGDAGNAPDAGVARAQVWIVEGEEAAGKLVARNLGPRVPVKTVAAADDLADGVDVVVGNNMGALARPVRSIKVPGDQPVC